MLPKPKHLEPEYGQQFQDRAIANAYLNRPPYPAQVFEILIGLITDEPRTVLDVGAGTGDVARPLVERVERIDAVDFSQAMLEKGRQLPNGQHPNLNWIYGSVEEALLQPPYALITAGESLHWLDWYAVFPRFRQILTTAGYVVIIGRQEIATVWQKDLQKLITQFSTNKDYRPYDLMAELELRQLFRKVGSAQTPPVAVSQTIDSYIESMHSRNGFSRQRMSLQAATQFDAGLKKLLTENEQEGLVSFELAATITCGKPKI